MCRPGPWPWFQLRPRRCRPYCRCRCSRRCSSPPRTQCPPWCTARSSAAPAAPPCSARSAQISQPVAARQTTFPPPVAWSCLCPTGSSRARGSKGHWPQTTTHPEASDRYTCWLAESHRPSRSATKVAAAGCLLRRRPRWSHGSPNHGSYRRTEHWAWYSPHRNN